MDKGETIAALKQKMSKVIPLQDEPNFATSEETIIRYLKAYDWKYKEAEKALLSTIEYRRQTRPLTVDCQYCHSRPGFHSMRQVGFDESGRPVVYSSFSQASIHKNTVDDLITHVTYLIENAKVTMNPGVSTWVFVIDCTFMTMGACSPKLGYNVTSVLASHYPERLGLVICVNISPLFHGVWKAVKKVLSPGTFSKVRLVRTDSKTRQVFSTYFSDELSNWLLEEIALNKCKPLPTGQIEFWNPPTPGCYHDPRGTATYIQNYIHSFKKEDQYCTSGQAKKHCPHPNIIDSLGKSVIAVSLTPQEVAERAHELQEISKTVANNEDALINFEEDEDVDLEVDKDGRPISKFKLNSTEQNTQEGVLDPQESSSEKPNSKLRKCISR